MTDAGRERRSTAMLAALVVLVVVVLFSTDLSVPRSWDSNRESLLRNAMHLATDDGFYYLEIARNVAQGAGSTFDELHPTNGYHPLWLLILVPIFWTTADAETAFLLNILLQSGLLVLSSVVLVRTLRLDCGWPFAALATLVWIRIQASHWIFFSGLEYALQTFVISLAGYYYLRDFAAGPPTSDRPYRRLGVVLALCFLARLEAVILALLLIGAILRSLPASGGRRTRAAIQLAAPLVICASAYAAINGWLFGAPLPVSGAMKAARSELLLSAELAASSHGYIGAKLGNFATLFETFNASFRWPLLFGLFAPLLVFSVPDTVRATLWSSAFRRRLRSWSPFVAFAWIHWGLVALVFHGSESYKPWYFVVPLWLAVVVGGALAEAMSGLARPTARGMRTPVALVLGVAVLVSITGNLALWRAGQRRPPPHQALLQEAAWIRDNVPPSALVGSWNAGVAGYFSERNVVNLDGLVNSWHYFREERFDLCRYWRETGIEYLVDMFPVEDELAYLDDHYAKWSEIGSCRNDVTIVWRGPAAGEWTPTALRIDVAARE